MLLRYLYLSSLCLLLSVSALDFPIKREMEVKPGTNIGFEFSEENLFNILRFKGTIDCVHYSFNSTYPMNAALWFERWAYLKEYATNHTVPPLDSGIVPGSNCTETTQCIVDFPKGKLPRLDSKGRIGQNAVPYTVVFWYDLNNTAATNVSLVVDGPCYTGEVTTLTFSGPTIITNTTTESA